MRNVGFSDWIASLRDGIASPRISIRIRVSLDIFVLLLLESKGVIYSAVGSPILINAFLAVSDTDLELSFSKGN